MMEGVNLTMKNFKKFCKCHNASSTTITKIIIKKQKRKYWNLIKYNELQILRLCSLVSVYVCTSPKNLLRNWENEHIGHSKCFLGWLQFARTCNPSSLGGRAQKDCGSRLLHANSFQTASQKYPTPKWADQEVQV
jgi:hypothetical protein